MPARHRCARNRLTYRSRIESLEPRRLLAITIDNPIVGTVDLNNTSETYQVGVANTTIQPGATLIVRSGVDVSMSASRSITVLAGGTLIVEPGARFLGDPDIIVESGGAARVNGATVGGGSGDGFIFEAGSSGYVRNSSFANSELRFFSQIDVSGNTFGSSRALWVGADYVDELTGNSFAANTLVEVSGDVTQSVTWPTIANIRTYEVRNTIDVHSGATLRWSGGYTVNFEGGNDPVRVFGGLVAVGTTVTGDPKIDVYSGGDLHFCDVIVDGANPNDNDRMKFFAGAEATIRMSRLEDVQLVFEGGAGITAYGNDFSGVYRVTASMNASRTIDLSENHWRYATESQIEDLIVTQDRNDDAAYPDVNVSNPLDFVPIKGDYNLNGVVDEADNQLWRSTYGSRTDLRADGNCDFVVNAADYTIWRDREGQVAPQAVTESGTDLAFATLLQDAPPRGGFRPAARGSERGALGAIETPRAARDLALLLAASSDTSGPGWSDRGEPSEQPELESQSNEEASTLGESLGGVSTL